MASRLSNPDRRSQGYLMDGDRFIGMVTFRLEEEQDHWGNARVFGDFALKGRKPRPGEVDGPLTILSEQGYSIHLEITRKLPQARFQFRVRRAESERTQAG